MVWILRSRFRDKEKIDMIDPPFIPIHRTGFSGTILVKNLAYRAGL
jgi:hypothetical protein